MAEPKTRWQMADDNFRRQIDLLMLNMRTNDKRRVADEAGISHNIFYARYRRPSTLIKREERMLDSLFSRYGMRYDPTMGEGGATA